MFQVGDRVGAIYQIKGRAVWYLGEGTYHGYHLRPGYLPATEETVREWLMGESPGFQVDLDPLTMTQEQVDGMVHNLKMDPNRTSEKIVLDNGELVWGHECVFDTKAQLEPAMAGYKVIPCRIIRDQYGIGRQVVEMEDVDP